MNLKITTDSPRLTDVGLEKGKVYEVLDIIQKDYIVKVLKKQKGKFIRVLVSNEDGELLED